MEPLPELLTIGQLAARSGVATSALRFYESEGLIQSDRTPGNQRRYPRATLRRVAVIQAAQKLGLTLAEIREAVDRLPGGRTPNRSDWQALSRQWRERLDNRIDELERLRNDLSECIGCGCLSLESCALLNNNDRISARGPGARFLLGDSRA